MTAVLVFTLLFSSCIKETFPTDIATADQIAGPSALVGMVNGIPTMLVQANSRGYGSGGSHWDFAMPAVHLALDAMTGDFVINGNVGYDHFSQFGQNNALAPNYAINALTWQNYYNWVKGPNDLINLITEDQLSDPVVSSYLAMAYAYRAMLYLDLVRMFEFKENKYTSAPDLVGLGVCIVTENTTPEEAKNNPRAASTTVYEMIIDDLDKAETLMGTYDAKSKYKLSLEAIYLLKARYYLERGTAGEAGAYVEAARYARKIIDSNKYRPLTRDQWEDTNNGFNNASANNSWIFALPQSSEEVNNLMNINAHKSGEALWGYSYFSFPGINKLLFDQIDDNDFRKYSFIDPGYKANPAAYPYKSINGASYLSYIAPYTSIKFRPAQGDAANYKVGGATDHVCMRVEEAYFIEAEATAHTDLSAAKQLLTEFMEYRFIDSSTPYDISSIATVEEFVEELILQKRIEFWGEGLLFFDMKRLAISTTRGYVGTNVPEGYRLNTEGVAPYWNLVIPRGEINNNPVVKNNPDPSGIIPQWLPPTAPGN